MEHDADGVIAAWKHSKQDILKLKNKPGERLVNTRDPSRGGPFDIAESKTAKAFILEKIDRIVPIKKFSAERGKKDDERQHAKQ